MDSAGNPFGVDSAGNLFGVDSAGNPFGVDSAGNLFGVDSGGEIWGREPLKKMLEVVRLSENELVGSHKGVMLLSYGCAGGQHMGGQRGGQHAGGRRFARDSAHPQAKSMQ